MPGIKVLLARCRQLDIHLGIISNAQFYTPFLFEWFLDADTTALGFDPRLTVYSFQHGVAKPSLLLFQLAARRLKRFGIAPHETAFIGNDVFNDIAPSLETGFQTILFAGDARSLRLRKNHPSCCEISADLVITDLAQIEHYLG
jgi:putative hydrolase of the HAD superfamily